MRTPLLVGLALLFLTPAPASAAAFTKPVSFSILEDYDKGEALSEVEADFHLMEELGIHTWRGSFGWDDYEPSRGTYDFDWLHRFADLAARHGMALRPYLGYTPAWAAAERGGRDGTAWNDPPARNRDWSRFAYRIAEAMARHPNVRSFEIYNEENAPLWWEGSASRYARVLKYGSDAIHAANPRAQVLIGGITYPDLEWMESTCAAGAPFDILPLHAYPETWSEPDVTVENYLAPGPEGFFHGGFLRAVDHACGAKPVWINEAGFATVPGENSERDQANWWARALATFLAIPRVEHIGIYEIKDHPPAREVIGEPENYHLGLTYHDRRKKLAFHTIRRLVSLLDAGTLTVADGELSVSVKEGVEGELYHHLFVRPDGAQVLFLWDKRGAPVVEAQVTRDGRRVVEYALDGTAAEYRGFHDRLLENVRLTPGEVRVFEITP